MLEQVVLVGDGVSFILCLVKTTQNVPLTFTLCLKSVTASSVPESRLRGASAQVT